MEKVGLGGVEKRSVLGCALGTQVTARIQFPVEGKWLQCEKLLNPSALGCVLDHIPVASAGLKLGWEHAWFTRACPLLLAAGLWLNFWRTTTPALGNVLWWAVDLGPLDLLSQVKCRYSCLFVKFKRLAYQNSFKEIIWNLCKYSSHGLWITPLNFKAICLKKLYIQYMCMCSGCICMYIWPCEYLVNQVPFHHFSLL